MNEWLRRLYSSRSHDKLFGRIARGVAAVAIIAAAWRALLIGWQIRDTIWSATPIIRFEGDIGAGFRNGAMVLRNAQHIPQPGRRPLYQPLGPPDSPQVLSNLGQLIDGWR